MITVLCLLVPPLFLLIVRERLFKKQDSIYKCVLLYLLYIGVINFIMILILAIFFDNRGRLIYKLNTYYNFSLKYFALAACLAIAEPIFEKYCHPLIEKIKDRLRLFKDFSIEGKKQYYITYTVVFIIAIILVFGCYFFNGKSFIWQGDGLTQHFRALLYYSKWLRTIIKTFITEHTLDIPLFSFSIGYGSDIITALHYYVIGDPLMLPSVLVKAKYMVYYFDAVVILRFYLSGLTFSMYCFYMKQKMEQHDKSEPFENIAILAGALVYVFSGFAIYAGIRHPYFINPMIYFPLVLLGAEKIFDGKKPYLFIISVFLSAVSNFYFFYMIVILTVLYAVWRTLTLYSLKDIKNIIKLFCKFAWTALLGTCMSAVILLPIIIAFFNTARSDTGYVYNLLYSLSSYETNIGGFIAPATGGHDWTQMGYAVIALIAVILLFIQKKHKDIKIAFIALTIMTLLPTIGSVMNGFSYVSNRWIWGYSLLIAYIVVLKWESLFMLTNKEKGILLTALSVYLLLCIVLVKSRTISALFAMGMAFLSVGVIFLTGDLFNIKTVQLLLVVCIIANLAGNAMFRFSPRNSAYAKEYIDIDGVLNRIQYDEAVAINSVAKDDDEFFRYSGSSTTVNGSLFSGLHNTQYYWSVENGDISNFRSEMALSDEINPFQYKTLDSRAALSTLANVKYYVQGSNAPYGFTEVQSVDNYSSVSDYLKKNLGDKYADIKLSKADEEAVKAKITNYKVWGNDNFLPFGYTYSGFIPKTDYDKMTPMQKQEALLQGCVVDDDMAQGEIADVEFAGQDISYEIQADKGVSVSDDTNTIKVTSANSTITLTFEGLPDSETYFYITGLNWSGISPLEQYSNLQWNLLSDYEKNEALYSERFYTEATSLNVSLSAKNSEGKSISKTLSYWTPKYTWYDDQKDFMINFGYDEDSKVSITLKFPTIGTYTYDSMQILCQPMAAYSDQVSALAEEVMSDVDFHENIAFATNNVTGTINLNSDKYLLLTIPYVKGWTAYVDGEKQNILRGNSMFMALYLPAGEHEISLTYCTPGLIVGASISLISLLIFIIYFLYGHKRDRKVELK